MELFWEMCENLINKSKIPDPCEVPRICVDQSEDHENIAIAGKLHWKITVKYSVHSYISNRVS